MHQTATNSKAQNVNINFTSRVKWTENIQLKKYNIYQH